MAAVSCSQQLCSRLAQLCSPSGPSGTTRTRASELFAPSSSFIRGSSLRTIVRASRSRKSLAQAACGLPNIRGQAGNEEASDSKGDSEAEEKIPFGYTRKDVILIGVGVTFVGVGIKYGLEALGVDSLRAGNAVQLIMVLGLTVGWISTYVFRVSTKEMTYAKQLMDYEDKVMKKRLEELPEAELEAMLAQVEEEKRRLQERRKNVV
eukprot:TRINITY_DN12571_c0_g1_i1.p1 TRINITY_DN12571_c0_g1~~TRINITY_DN12571_c0_g1_i1.p1  ORF type:complete len:236 (+),score=27.60 TRINITY_DN12571_c0_g1_i1:90-710(+)